MAEALSYAPQEAYRKPRGGIVESGGFSVEYERSVNEQGLRDDVISYLGEYRFHLGRFDYQFLYSGGMLRDVRTREPLRVKTQNAITEKQARWQDPYREIAEDIGAQVLDEKIARANKGDSIWWASLPGIGKNFGKYAFIFTGEVVDDYGRDKFLSMSAIRVENPSLLSFNQSYARLTGQRLNAHAPEDFLVNPVVITGVTKERLEAEIRDQFEVNGGEDEREWFRMALEQLRPAIEDFIMLVRNGTQEQKLEAFYALEKHAVNLKKLREEGKNIAFEVPLRLSQLTYVYKDTELESASGSCPIDNESGNIFERQFAFLNKVLFGGKEWFKCPICKYQATAPVGNQCPSCHITKEKYAQTVAAVCD